MNVKHTEASPNNIKIKIDNIEVEAPDFQTLMEVARIIWPNRIPWDLKPGLTRDDMIKIWKAIRDIEDKIKNIEWAYGGVGIEEEIKLIKNTIKKCIDPELE
jgi:hypothetical protein